MEPDPRPPVVPLVELESYEHFVTEDDTPVDSLLCDKQMRLLVEPLYSSRAAWVNGRKFLATANVGMFYEPEKPAVVPDVLLSMDVQAPTDLKPKKHRSYFIWLYGKPPDVVVEIVSNNKGGEADVKLELYARIGVPYYVILDPFLFLSEDVLQVYGLRDGQYERVTPEWLPGVGVGLTFWLGSFEEMDEYWLRWSDHNGQVIPTGAERAAREKEHAEQAEQDAKQAKQDAKQAKQDAKQAKQRVAEAKQRAEQAKQRAAEAKQRAEQEKQRAEQEKQRAEQEKQRAEQEKQRANHEKERAEQEKQRAEQEKQRAERLAERLRVLGIDPNS